MRSSDGLAVYDRFAGHDGQYSKVQHETWNPTEISSMYAWHPLKQRACNLHVCIGTEATISNVEAKGDILITPCIQDSLLSASRVCSWDHLPISLFFAKYMTVPQADKLWQCLVTSFRVQANLTSKFTIILFGTKYSLVNQKLILILPSQALHDC